jgi:hypothetical protein
MLRCRAVGRPRDETPGPRAGRASDASLRRALALLWVGVAAKLALVGLRASDGEAAGLLGPWGPPTLLYQELWAAIGLYGLDRALLSLGTWLKRPVLADRLCWALYAALAGYTAINVPIARQFSTPLTYAFVEAAGGALRDSVTQYATAGNVAALVGLLAWALVVPRLVRAPRRGWAWCRGVGAGAGAVRGGAQRDAGAASQRGGDAAADDVGPLRARPAAPQEVRRGCRRRGRRWTCRTSRGGARDTT